MMDSRRFHGRLVALLAVLAFAAPGLGQPSWRLDFEQQGLKRVLVKTGARSVAHYYLVFSVTNPSDRELPFHPDFHLLTNTKKKGRDTGDLRTAKAVNADRKGARLLSRSERPDSIAAGETLTCVATFGPLDPNADEIRIDVTGLRDVVVTRNGQDFFEKSAMRLVFERPGDEFGADRDPVHLKKQEWVVLEGPEPVR